jgi:hypothetical protein
MRTKLDRHMASSADDVTSLSSNGGSACQSPAMFTTTHWSVVLEAQGESPAAQEALEKLCRTYWQPIYGFVRRQGAGPEETKDLTQGFFALLLERRDLNAVRKEKGRLRSYLLTSLKHFLTNERSRAMAVKRGEGQRLVVRLPARESRELHAQASAYTRAASHVGAAPVIPALETMVGESGSNLGKVAK